MAEEFWNKEELKKTRAQVRRDIAFSGREYDIPVAMDSAYAIDDESLPDEAYADDDEVMPDDALSLPY